jgi:anti-sigma factor RsiW
MTGGGNLDRDPQAGDASRCERVVELLTDYLEGELGDATRTELEAHLAACDACAEYLRQLRITVSALGQVRLDQLSESAQATLRAALRETAEPTNLRP